jgi:hypothetical protein
MSPQNAEITGEARIAVAPHSARQRRSPDQRLLLRFPALGSAPSAGSALPP